MSRIYCLYSARDGQSRLIEAALQLDEESMGRVSTGFMGARGWMYGVVQRERCVDWHTAGPGGLSVMLEGRMDIEVGNGDKCTVLPGDLLFERPGVRVYVPLATMLLVSLAISAVMWLFRR